MHYSILLTQLIHHLGMVDGRKKFQKIVHILQSAGAPFEERFEYANFGPYSATLQAEIHSLCEFGYLKEAPDGMSFQFTAGEHFSKIENEDFVQNTPTWAMFAKSLNQKTPRELEALSTVLFLQRLGYDEASIEQKFARLKPHLNHHYHWAIAMAVKINNAPGNWEKLTEAN